jgi:diadenosine tetraphosphate (Ap4A) HIT family hydrolase
MDPCCSYHADASSRTLFESDNFYVAPPIGSMGIKGYVLISSKEHFIGTGDLPDAYRAELAEVVDHTRRVLRDTFHQEPFTFEHGPRVYGFRGGGCIDHAHIHMLPSSDVLDIVAAQTMRQLHEDTFTMTSRHPTIAEALKRASDIYDRQRSSYAIAAYDEFQLLLEVNFPLPSQFLRRVVARENGNREWNWRKDPDLDTMAMTMELLAGRF